MQQQKQKKAAGGGYDHGSKHENFTAYMLQPYGQQQLSQSSGFSTFDTSSLRMAGQTSEPLKLEQMVTLAIFKSSSGTIKKMLHGPSLKIYCVKEVPLANTKIRNILKEWVNKWQSYCTTEQYIRVFDTFYNSPEGCVSVI